MTDIAAVSDLAKGWLFQPEGPALREAALSAPCGPFVEIGSYCGKSTVWLGSAAREMGTVLFAVDHHRGSMEMQPGRENHDPALTATGDHDTLFGFRSTIHAAGLEHHVVAVVGESTTVATHWRAPVGLVFIDAGHSYLEVRADFVAWARWLVPGGLLVFHDTTIPDIDKVASEAVDVGFLFERQVETLRVLRRPS